MAHPSSPRKLIHSLRKVEKRLVFIYKTVNQFTYLKAPNYNLIFKLLHHLHQIKLNTWNGRHLPNEFPNEGGCPQMMAHDQTLEHAIVKDLFRT